MNAKTEKRVLKGYKIKGSLYKKAMKRAKKNKVALATLIENWVNSYANGLEIGIIDLTCFNSEKIN